MLIIHNARIIYPDDPKLNKAFGVCYNRNEKVDEFIIAVITDSKKHKFDCMNDFVRFVTDSLRGGRGYLVLLAEYFYNCRKNGKEIKMTGSRSRDIEIANGLIELDHTPYGYSWHHAEGIGLEGNSYKCKMYLVRTKYHCSVSHVGGVHEYELVTGRKYRR